MRPHRLLRLLTSQHATAHAGATGHPIVQSFEPGEDWFYDYAAKRIIAGPQLAPPTSRPRSQPAPGPAGRVPANWRNLPH